MPATTTAKPALVVSDRLEIILPEDVSLVKFLGSGGYGEVGPTLDYTGSRLSL